MSSPSHLLLGLGRFTDMKTNSRVWRHNEEVSAKLSAEMKPVEEVWEGRTWFSAWNHDVPMMVPGNTNRNY